MLLSRTAEEGYCISLQTFEQDACLLRRTVVMLWELQILCYWMVSYHLTKVAIIIQGD